MFVRAVGVVRRIETAYEVRGMVASLTSYDDPDPGQGTPLNQVRYRYNAFAQLDCEWQAHRGLVSWSNGLYVYRRECGNGVITPQKVV